TASATSGTSTIRFINGATSNTITNASIQGSFSGAVGTNGGNIFFSTDASTTNGNDNNTISNCNIGPAGTNLPTKGVYLNGTTTGTYNFVAFSSSSVLVPVLLSVGTTTATSVQGNTIAGIAMSGAGAGTSSSAAFRGIYVSSGLTTIGNVTGNTIGSQSTTGS